MTGLQAAGPVLAGVRVLDLTRLLPGNYATLVLYGLGAEIIKVEDAAGDGTRYAPPLASTSESGPDLVLNRGKGSISLDLKRPEAQQLLLELVAGSAVVVDSFRPGVLDRLGLGPAALAEANPKLVHVSITAYGEGGPDVALAAHDLNAQSLAGLLSLATDSDGAPEVPAVTVADLASGMQAALAVLAGLRAVDRGSAGYRANIAMSDSALAFTGLAAGHLAAGNDTLPATPDMLTGALACYGVYRCADDGWLAVGGLESKFFSRMCEVLGRPELASWQYDLARQVELRDQLAAVFLTRGRDEWSALLRPADTCVTPVNNLAEAFAEAYAVQRGVVVAARLADGREVPVVRAVPWLPEVAAPAGLSLLGGDAERLLRPLGISAAEVAQLRETGIVGGTS
jgi:crotonobetainyl-CoA:carnitine CoA-transferase CaiB-like acyl-CoA transferase